jgi:amino acid transporter
MMLVLADGELPRFEIGFVQAKRMNLARREPSSPNGLKLSVLSSNETLAQSFALIAPTAAPLLTVPLVYASAGAGTWLAFLISTLTILLVALNVNHFARISCSPGSLYSYISSHMHPIWGVVAAWALLIAYFGTAIAIAAGLRIYVNVILKNVFGLEIAPLLLTIAAIGFATWLAYRDVTLSARLMLLLEAGSVSLILCVALCVLAKQGFHPDMVQLQLQGVTAGKLRMGLVLAIFCFVGFESATSLGSEAKDPLRTIPRAVKWSGLLAGLFFCFCAYAEVLGFRGQTETLDKSVAPLETLVRAAGLPSVLAVLIGMGAIVSFFSCVLACLTAGARILFLMGEKGALPSLLGRAHSDHQTPHCAVIVSAAATILPLGTLTLFQFSAPDIYGLLGTLATFGFLIAYILVSIAAPLFLYRRGRLTPFDAVISLAALIGLAVAFLGSLYPVPAAPYSLLPYIFLAMLLAGIGWSLALNPGRLTFREEKRTNLDFVAD